VDDHESPSATRKHHQTSHSHACEIASVSDPFMRRKKKESDAEHKHRFFLWLVNFIFIILNQAIRFIR
jgi:hypothetical protein